ncbi:hypothetical protein ES703_54673 [subsurface metagenome]
MSKYSGRKIRQDFQGAVCKSLVYKNLPAYAVKYFMFDIERLDIKSFRTYWGKRTFKKEIGQNEIMQAKSIFHLFRNGLIKARYKQPIKGGYTIGRIYAKEVPTSGITARTEIDQEIKKLCGRIDRPKNLSLLYNKIPMLVDTQSQVSGHTIPKKDDLVDTQSQFSGHTVVPKSDTSFKSISNNLGLSLSTAKKQDLNSLNNTHTKETKKEESSSTVGQEYLGNKKKIELDYLEKIENKDVFEKATAQDLKEWFVCTSRFETFGQEHHGALAQFIEGGVNFGTLARAGMTYRRKMHKRGQRRTGKKEDFLMLIEAVKNEHAVIAKPLN